MIERGGKHRDGPCLVREAEFNGHETQQRPDAECDLQEAEKSDCHRARPQAGGIGPVGQPQSLDHGRHDDDSSTGDSNDGGARHHVDHRNDHDDSHNHDDDHDHDDDHHQPADTPFRLGDWLVEPRLNRLSLAGVTVQLELKAMDVLLCLVEHAGELVTKADLVDAVWQTEFVSDNTLANYVAVLRSAFGDDAHEPRYIETIRKRGYRSLKTNKNSYPSSRRLYRRYSITLVEWQSSLVRSMIHAFLISSPTHWKPWPLSVC